MLEATHDTVVIEHETMTRLANLVVTVVPLALVGFAGWLAWGGALHWQDLVVLGDHLHPHGRLHDRRLPPPLHPPKLQDHPGNAGTARDSRVSRGRGLHDRMGLQPPKASPLHRPAR